MKVDTSKTTSTWSTGGIGGKTSGAVGGSDGGSKLPVQPGCSSTTKVSSTDTFDTSTSSSTSVNLTGT